MVTFRALKAPKEVKRAVGTQPPRPGSRAVGFDWEGALIVLSPEKCCWGEPLPVVGPKLAGGCCRTICEESLSPLREKYWGGNAGSTARNLFGRGIDAEMPDLLLGVSSDEESTRSG